MKRTWAIYIIIAISLIYCLLIATDASVYLRGFAPYPQWTWLYSEGHLTYKLIFPVFVITLAVVISRGLLNKSADYILGHEKRIVTLICLICLLFQLSVLYACAGGIAILVQRTIHPNINGYWSAALTIKSLPDFLNEFHNSVKGWQGVAEFHPPGSILFYWFINQASALITSSAASPSYIQPSHSDLQLLWNRLAPNEKVGGLLAGYVIMLLTSSTCGVLYYIGKIKYSVNVGLRSGLLCIFIPAFTFFTPFTDVVFALRTGLAFYMFLHGLQKRRVLSFFVAGMLLFIGAFFTLQTLAIIVVYATVTMPYIIRRQYTMREVAIFTCTGIAGFLSLPIVLYAVYGFNIIASVSVILGNHVGFVQLRRHPLWLFYNYYDFFMFFGIPLLIIFLLEIYSSGISLFKKHYKPDFIFIGFLVMALLIDISGTMNGETGRTWIPFIPFILIPLAAYISEIDKKGQLFPILVITQGVQVITLVTVLVTVS